MKIVIDIPEAAFEMLKEKASMPSWIRSNILNAVANGTSLPKGHGRLIDADKLIKDNGLAKATKYGNETKEELLFSYGTMMMYEIFDLIDDAEVVIEADEEGA